jgi:gamma-glutamyltranspeptidase/glutathione hydrolase/leukotriene-C4 hydrolase
LLANLTSKDFAMQVIQQISDTRTYTDPGHYGARTEGVENHGTAHINILAPDGSAVSVTSTINSVYVLSHFYYIYKSEFLFLF